MDQIYPVPIAKPSVSAMAQTAVKMTPRGMRLVTLWVYSHLFKKGRQHGGRGDQRDLEITDNKSRNRHFAEWVIFEPIPVAIRWQIRYSLFCVDC